MRIRCLVVPLLAGAILAAARPGAAQASAPQPSPPPAPSVEQLQKKIEDLASQLALVRQQLAELQSKQKAAEQEAEVARLRQAAAAAASAQTPTSAGVEPSTRFVSGTRMQPQLNPEISLIGDMYGVGGSSERTRASAGEWELDVQSALDPYSRVHFVLSMPEGEPVGLEEGYVTWLNLPGSTSLTVGRMRQQFGVLNRWHPHALDQAEAPWVLQESFGPEGLKGTGVSLDWLMPKLWADTNELTVQVTNGDNEVAFAGADWRKPTVLARLKNYWDISSNSYVEVGLNALHGSADPNGTRRHDFYATDFTYDWYPAKRSTYHEFTLRGMVLLSQLAKLDGSTRDAWGGYVYGQYKLSQHWIAGVRYDRVGDQREANHDYWGISPYLTLWQSEFVRLRGEASYRRDNLLGTDHRFLLQLTVAAGPHKHDTY